MNYFSGNYLNLTKSFTAAGEKRLSGNFDWEGVAGGCARRRKEQRFGVTPVQGNGCYLGEAWGHATGGQATR